MCVKRSQNPTKSRDKWFLILCPPLINILVPFQHGGDTEPCVMDKRFWNNQMCVQFLSNSALLTPNLAGLGSLPRGFWLLGQEL